MHASSIILGFLAAASTALAAPAADIEARAAAPAWTITDYRRSCDTKDKSCRVYFGIDTHVAGSGVTLCYFTLEGAPASQASVDGITCGPYTVSSAWSGQFGPNNGFTTLSVVNVAKKQIVWPAYTDKEAGKDNVPVTPNKSYVPASL